MPSTNTQPAARCLDLTRLISRVGRGCWTGIDRVEAAYLRTCLNGTFPVFALVRFGRFYFVFDRNGMAAVQDRLDGRVAWGRNGFWANLTGRNNSDRRQAARDLHRLALAKSRRAGLPGLLARHLPAECVWINVGHTNLARPVFDAFHAMPGGQAHVMVHDMIPLEHPALQRPATPKEFESRMRTVSACADRVIYNSQDTRHRAEGFFQAWGRIPPGSVAHLGIETLVPEMQANIGGFDRKRPYFTIIGTIEPRKNHALLFEVWEEFARNTPPEQGPQLVIVGARGWNNDAVFRWLDTSPLVGRSVHELGPLSDHAMVEVAKHAQAVLFPSLAEGFGLPVGEAISLKVPVVANSLPVLWEIYGNIPIYAKAADRYSWLKILGDLIENKGTEQTSGAAHDHAVTLPTWQTHFNLVLNVS